VAVPLKSGTLRIQEFGMIPDSSSGTGLFKKIVTKRFKHLLHKKSVSLCLIEAARIANRFLIVLPLISSLYILTAKFVFVNIFNYFMLVFFDCFLLIDKLNLLILLSGYIYGRYFL